MHGILFTDPSALRSELIELGLLDSAGQDSATRAEASHSTVGTATGLERA